jgi:hypothetical protein
MACGLWSMIDSRQARLPFRVAPQRRLCNRRS